MHAPPGYTAADLRTAAPEPVVAELVELTRLLHTSRTLPDWRRDAPGRPITTGPLGIAAPIILPGWAEGDLLIGSTLWEVTTTIRPDASDALHRLLWRLLACAWLDTRDVYGIRSVGIYLARYGVAVAWGARTLGRSYHDAEDAAAEAMQELFKPWDSIAEEDRLPSVFTITHNKYVSMVRRAKTRQKHLCSADARPRETGLESGIELLATSEALQSLPPRRRQIIRLDVEGLSHAEIAQVLGITEESVAQEMSRAHNKLRRLMGRGRPARRRKPREDTAWEGGTSA